MEGHICRQNTLMFALVFCFELRARAARTCCHCHLQAAVKNPIHDGKRGQLKLPKKSWTVPQCVHVTLNCVQMASKQQNVEFSSHIFQFTRLHGVAVIQGLTFRDSVVTLFKSTRWYVFFKTRGHLLVWAPPRLASSGLAWSCLAMPCHALSCLAWVRMWRFFVKYKKWDSYGEVVLMRFLLYLQPD